MKAPILYILIILSAVIGIFAISTGVKRQAIDKSRFSLFLFIKKGFQKTEFSDFTGSDVISFGVLTIIIALLLLYFYKDLLIYRFI
jgi:hypothetical protein